MRELFEMLGDQLDRMHSDKLEWVIIMVHSLLTFLTLGLLWFVVVCCVLAAVCWFVAVCSGVLCLSWFSLVCCVLLILVLVALGGGGGVKLLTQQDWSIIIVARDVCISSRIVEICLWHSLHLIPVV